MKKSKLLPRRKKRHPLRSRAVHSAPPEVLTPDPLAQPTTIRGYFYGPDRLVEHDPLPLEQLGALHRDFPVVWIDVAGVRDVALIGRIGECFKLHPLALEDVVHTHQRAKVEDYEAYQFIVIRMAPLEWEEDTDQLAMFVGPGYVITFQERPGDDFDPIRERLRSGRGRLRSQGADYPAYSILDASVDAYFPLLERNGELLEELEDDLVCRPGNDALAEIYKIRRRLLILRRAVWPLREAVGSLMREENDLFRPETRKYLRDVYDHSVQIIDLMETYRELSSNLMDVYLSSMGNRLNEVMKVLTIITTIFIPLSFIAGIYGMNFDTEKSPWNMPELKWHYGYPFCLGAVALIAVVEIYFFRRKGWLGEPAGDRQSLISGESCSPREAASAGSNGSEMRF